MDGINRRNLLKGLLALSVAPAICKAENLMKIAVPKKTLLNVDGVELREGDSILWLDLAQAQLNGIYMVASSKLTREVEFIRAEQNLAKVKAVIEYKDSVRWQPGFPEQAIKRALRYKGDGQCGL